ncbi:MAG TPA: sigma-54 dependent transcriptional regulator [Kofleriaceae bacterium]|nr:sigma-54 dependent transcriptional regulator [Kofleriaceae bacterium]
MPPEARILVVDDHVEMADVLADRLRDEGFQVVVAGGGEEALDRAREQPPDVVVTDLRMAGVDGLDVMRGVHAIDREIPVIIMTAFGAVDSAVEAIQQGAHHYIIKPLRLDEALVHVQRALEQRRLRVEHRRLERTVRERFGLAAMVGGSAPMRALFELCERVALSSAPVLVRGESGTGKELVARAIHLQGERRDRPLVAVNCTALPGTLLESELFGHVRGAFTGATAARAGLFVEADGGTLFLDEIGDMDAGLQAKVLRVLEDGEVRAVGADSSRRVDVRIITATNRDLEQRVREGHFREDLFYRLDVVPVRIPPLRERAGDVPILADHFLARALARNAHSRVRRLSPEVLAAFERHSWPGNVRELENVVQRLVVVGAAEEVGRGDLEAHAPAILAAPAPVEQAVRQMVTLRQLEAEYIEWVLARCDGNKTRAAEILGVDVSTIHRRKKGSQ